MKQKILQWLRIHPSAQGPAYRMVARWKHFKGIFISPDIQSSKPILFIVGAGRSGNTILRKSLVEKYQIYIPAETYVLPSAMVGYLNSSNLRWDDRVRLVLSYFEYHPEFPTMSKKSLSSVFNTCVSFSPAEKTYGNIVHAVFEFMAKQSSCTYQILGDKTPLNTLSLGLISNMFPNAKFLFVTRNPYDVVASYIKMGRYQTVDQSANRWKESHEAWINFRKFLNSKNFLEISYENFVADSHSELEVIADWLSIDKRDNSLPEDFFWGDLDTLEHHAATLTSINNSAVGKGQNALSERQREEVALICNPTSIKFQNT